MVQIIAEIGCNHKGQLDIAKTMIEIAKTSGAHIAKFQKRNNKKLFTKEEYERPHIQQANSYGRSYGEHREKLEFSIEQHRELKKHCEGLGIIYSTSVWDINSAKGITKLNPQHIKVPSAINLDFEMQEFLCKNFKGKIHVSVGMTNISELRKILKFYNTQNRENDLIVYSCTSGYPIQMEEICLLEIKKLEELLKHTKSEIGFSGHHLGIAPDIAAVTLGAKWIERHFTLDRTWKGTDHAASLEPDGLKKLCRDVENVQKALQFKYTDILPVEEVQRKKLKKFFI